MANFANLKDKYAIWHYRTQWFDKPLIQKTNAELDKEMSESQADVGPTLKELGYTLSVPRKSICSEGDPALYKYHCSTQAIITPQNNPAPNVIPSKISSELLRSFSDQMVHKQWKPSDGNSWVLTWFDSYIYYNKPETFALSFDRKNCHLYLLLDSPMNNKIQHYPSMSCAKSLLGGFYY